MLINKETKIAIIGLGYVGLPLAVALSKYFTILGFDVNEKRVQELNNKFDHTNEISKERLEKTMIQFTTDSSQLTEQAIYIVTVPTPIDQNNLPDLTCLKKASETVGKSIKPGAIVVYESTVYPGVTEDFCGKILEQNSDLTCGKDFFLGYSPERINPGDKEHTVDKITKVVAGQTPKIAQMLSTVYGAMNQNNIFVAENIKTAEAAKVIENTQRDINIAFINEISTIVKKLDLSIYDVLAAANTKWNFLNFQPGLVGGHCIGVDPYYLAHCARQLNVEPEIILAGRKINEKMGNFIAEHIHSSLQKTNCPPEQAKILMLGLTFKENIPDLRNTKTVDIISALQSKGYTVDAHDPCVDPLEAQKLIQANLIPNLDTASQYNCIIGAVPHKPYLAFRSETFHTLLKPGGLIVDIKNLWKNIVPDIFTYWTL